MKRIQAFLLALCMLASICLFTACGEQGNETTEGTQASGGYRVKVVDALGNPYTTGMIVRFMQNGQQAAMQKLGEDGMAVKELPDGDYTVELQFTGSETYHYDQTDLTLSADKKELEIVLSYAVGGEGMPLYAQGMDTTAYPVGVGCTYVELTPGQRNYFLFIPTEAGKYEFSVVGSDSPIGYYGAPHFVQADSATEVVNNTFIQSIRPGMIGGGETGTAVLVIGIDAAEETSTILAIQRIGEPDRTIDDEPWQIYETSISLNGYTLPDGVKLNDFDLTAATDAYDLVLGADNYYHLNSADGPLVLVRLGKNSGLKYTDSYESILENASAHKYFYDADGNFVKKEGYNQCLLGYMAVMDANTGLYPLTEDLKYIIQQSGDHEGWFDPNRELGFYLFEDSNGNPVAGINDEISWLFMCCYIGQ